MKAFDSEEEVCEPRRLLPGLKHWLSEEDCQQVSTKLVVGEQMHVAAVLADRGGVCRYIGILGELQLAPGAIPAKRIPDLRVFTGSVVTDSSFVL